MPVMNSFCWVAERGGRIVGILMAAPCHGLIFLVRMSIEDSAPKATALLLFRAWIKDSLAMGFKAYFTYINPQGEVERSMIPMCERGGGFQIQEGHIPLAGSLEKAARILCHH
jgi:hypothetical protein